MPDFLDEIVAARQRKNPAFEGMVDAALERRRMLRELTEERVAMGLSQTTVAALMGTSQSSVARIESGNADVKLSTLERYASTMGKRIEWRIQPASSKPERGTELRGSSKKEAKKSRKPRVMMPFRQGYTGAPIPPGVELVPPKSAAADVPRPTKSDPSATSPP